MHSDGTDFSQKDEIQRLSKSLSIQDARSLTARERNLLLGDSIGTQSEAKSL